MEKRELTCIGCPLGCQITVELENGEVVSITGNTCKRGSDYAAKEVTNPERTVTSTVKIESGLTDTYLPVRTASDIPKGKIFECMQCLKGVTVKAPVRAGDTVITDVAGTGVNVIAAKTVEADNRLN